MVRPGCPRHFEMPGHDFASVNTGRNATSSRLSRLSGLRVPRVGEHVGSAWGEPFYVLLVSVFSSTLDSLDSLDKKRKVAPLQQLRHAQAVRASKSTPGR